MWQLLQLQPVADTKGMEMCDNGMESYGTVVAHSAGNLRRSSFDLLKL